MAPAENERQTPSVPVSLIAPCSVEESTETIPLWSGSAELAQPTKSQVGEASVFFDMLPRPIVRFTFQCTSEGDSPGVSWFRHAFEKSALDDGELRCASPLGNITVEPLNVTGGSVSGAVGRLASISDERFTSAKLFVVNGPEHRGNAIRKDGGGLAGRLQSTVSGESVIVDRLFFRDQSARSLFAFTHVAEIRFAQPQPIAHFDTAAATLFRTLSLMRGRWVGLVGPWLYIDDVLHTISPRVTKTTRKSAGQNWCPDMVLGVFEELFACLQAAYQDSERAEALQTGLHWLIESDQCAGGVEGAIILQQAALEALAWFDIVQHRKLCSTSGFEKLPASDKIRWLTSLYSIPTVIPPHYIDLVNFANDYPEANDLPGILVDVRNALVQGSPKKVKRLFGRNRGEDERTALWYLVMGLLEQAVLAIAGYRGKTIRRDIDAEWKVSAVKQVPWSPEER